MDDREFNSLMERLSSGNTAYDRQRKKAEQAERQVQASSVPVNLERFGASGRGGGFGSMGGGFGGGAGGQTGKVYEDKTLLDRALNTFSGAAKQFGSGFVNAYATVREANSDLIDSEMTPFLDQSKEMQAYFNDRSQKSLNNGDAEKYKKIATGMQPTIDRYANRPAENHAATQAARELADTLSASGATDIAQAKAGLGKVGRFAVDFGSAGSQMLGDAALGGGSALVPMAIRSFGGGAQEARQAGATLNQQLAYGVGSGALSVLTEKIANVASPFQKMFGKGVLDDAIKNVTGRLTSSAAGKLALSALSEGGEEVIENALSTALQKATYNKDASFDLSGALYDGLVGAALGGIGGAVDVVSSRKGTNAPTETQTAEPAAQAQPPVNPAVKIFSDALNDNKAQENPVVQESRARAADSPSNSPLGVSATQRGSVATVAQTQIDSKPKTETQQQQSVPDTSVGAATAGFAGDTERGFSKNLASDKARDPSIQEDYQLDPEMYHRLANQDTLQKATDIFGQGQETAKAQLEQAIGAAKSGMKLAPEMVPLAKMVADKLAADGDIDSARRILSDVALELTTAGQLGQAAAILRDAGPAARVETVDKAIEEINQKGREKYGHKWNDFSLTDAEIGTLTSLENGDEAGYKTAYENIAKRIGKEMPSTVWEKLTEFRRVAMLMNPKTQVRNVTANAPLMLERKVSEKISGAIQDFLVKRGKLEKADQTRTSKVDAQSKTIAAELYDTHKETLLNGANKWDMNGMMREYRKYFGDSMLGRGMDAARSFTYMLLEQGDQPFFRNAFLDSAAQNIAAHGYESMDAVPQSVIDHAAQQAMEATFKDACWFSDALNKAKNKGGPVGSIVDILLPFTTTPVNIARRSIDYSPAGIIFAIDKLNKGGSDADFIDGIARALTGTTVMGASILLAKMGLITGAADDDKDKAAFDRQNGKLPFAFGGKVSYDWAQPFAAQLATGAAIYEAIRGQDGVLDALLDSVKVTGDTMAEMTLFSNIKDLLQGYGSTTENIRNAILNGIFGQMVPSIVGATARSMDDTVRSSVTDGNVLDKAVRMSLAKIPGASKSLPASVDTWGNDVKRIQNPIGRTAQEFLNPANISTGTYDALDSEIERLYDATGKKSVYPQTAPYDFDGEKLTGEARAKFQRTQGQNAQNFVSALMESETYQTADDVTKVKQIERAHSFAKAIARNEYDPDYDGEDWAKAIESMKSGIDPAAFFMVDSELRMRDTTPGTTAAEYAQAIESSNSVADEYKGKLWQLQNSSWSPEKNPYTGTLAKAGIGTDTILQIMEKESAIYGGDSNADSKDKGMEFSKYLDSQHLTDNQRKAVDGLYRHVSRAYDYKTMTAKQQKVWDNWADGKYSMDEFIKLYGIMNAADKKDDAIEALAKEIGSKSDARRFYEKANKKY